MYTREKDTTEQKHTAENTKSAKLGNYLLIAGVVLLNLFVLGYCFDFYLDLNDDMMMKDIMAGIYSGTPDGHNMQTLYLLGGFVSLLYKIAPSIPWYGLFLGGCQVLVIDLIGARLLFVMKNIWNKILAMGLLSLIWWGILLNHFVNVQYTITCALLSAGAIFLFLTSDLSVDQLSIKEYFVRNIPSILLVVLAYQLRTEMLLLTFPFIGLAGIFRWYEEAEKSCEKGVGGVKIQSQLSMRERMACVFQMKYVQKYCSVLGAMLLLMLLSLGADKIAYGSDGWKDFIRYFDARTTVYDFYPETVTDDGYRDGLSKLGIDLARQQLLRNYNYGLDDEMTLEQMEQIASFAKHTVGKNRDYRQILKKQILFYFYRLTHSGVGGDAPYNYVVIGGYLLVLITCILCGKYGRLWQPVILGLMRTAIWMFILLRGRDPERITHSLYLVEFILIAGMLLRIWIPMMQKKSTAESDKKHVNKYNRNLIITYVFASALAIYMICIIPGTFKALVTNQTEREQVNKDYETIDAYCRSHKEAFYFEDVYSTVGFSEKLLNHSVTGMANYEILGGWICKSPLYFEKLTAYEIRSVSEALLEREDVYLIMSDLELDEQGFDWLIDYYALHHQEVSVEEADRINDRYGVYRVRSIKEHDAE